MKKQKISRKIVTALAIGFVGFGSYHEAIPLDKITEVLNASGLVLLQEDGTAWEGFFCGTEGRAKIEIGHKETATVSPWGPLVYKPVQNAILVIEWFLISTKYDVNVYVG